MTAISLKIITEFHRRRTTAHIASVNYFAGLLGGARFPDHDCDKFAEPMLTPYALKNYSNFHSGFVLSDVLESEVERMRRQHHLSMGHHPESFANVADMPDDCLTEMVCDWFAANNEQALLQGGSEYSGVMDFYLRYARGAFGFAPRQMGLITDLIRELNPRADKEKFLEIWKDVK